MAVLLHNGNITDYYQGMTPIRRFGDFMSQRPSDAFKAVGAFANVAISVTDMEPDDVRFVSNIGRTASKIMGDGIDAAGLPGQVAQLMAKPKEILNVTGVIDKAVKAAKFASAAGFAKLGVWQGRVQIAQNAAGAVTCSVLASRDWEAIQKRAPGADRPEFVRKAYANTMFAKQISLVKNVARTALNGLALLGTVGGIVTWSPIMLTLATTGIVGSIASFFFKQNAAIIKADAISSAEKSFEVAIEKVQNRESSLKDRALSALTAVKSPFFAASAAKHQIIGHLLSEIPGGEFVDRVYTAVYVANGENDEGVGAEYGRIAAKHGVHFADRSVRDAIVEALSNYLAE